MKADRFQIPCCCPWKQPSYKLDYMSYFMLNLPEISRKKYDKSIGFSYTFFHIHCPPEKPLHCMKIDETGGAAYNLGLHTCTHKMCHEFLL